MNKQTYILVLLNFYSFIMFIILYKNPYMHGISVINALNITKFLAQLFSFYDIMRLEIYIYREHPNSIFLCCKKKIRFQFRIDEHTQSAIIYVYMT